MGTLNIDALLIAGRGIVLTRNPNTAGPTYAELVTLVSSNGTTLPTGCTPMGHTDPSDLPEWDSEGGETEVKPTWWTAKAREITTSTATKWFLTKQLQFDNDTMTFYEGGGTFANPNEFISPANPAAIEKGCTIVYIDNGNIVAEDMARVSFRGDGAIEHATDDWSKIPIRGTILTPTGAFAEHRWLGEYFGTP